MFPALLPKSAPFFAMLNEQNDLLRRMSALLVNMLEDVSNMDHVHKEIAFLEEEADLLHSKIIRALSQTFITPIDREDILRINQEQEECMDCLHSLSTRLHIFEFASIRFPALQMARTISAMLDLTYEMLAGLANRRDLPPPNAQELVEAGRIRLRDDVVRGDDVRVAYTWLIGKGDSAQCSCSWPKPRASAPPWPTRSSKG